MPSLAERVANYMQKADAVDLAEVRTRFRKIHGASEDEARTCERELKRYLALGIARPDADYQMRSGPVDEFWHVFLIFTQRYLDFCRDVFGVYIHHVPDTDAEESTPGDANTASTGTRARAPFETFARDYADVFGEAPPEIWHHPPLTPHRPTGAR